MSMEPGNLVSAIEQASSKTHVREFEVGGQTLVFPRLSTMNQGLFEREVRKTNPTFTLAGTRNKGAMVLANVFAQCKRAMVELRKGKGLSDRAATPEEAKEMAIQLQEDVMKTFEPYADRIFGGFTRDQMLWVVACSLQMQYGEEITYMKPVEGGEPVSITAKVDEKFADTLFGNEPGRIFENVFMYTSGLAEEAAQTDVEKTEAELLKGMSVEEIATEVLGDEENSAGEQDSE